MEFFSWTYFFRRLLSNPSYYGLKESNAKEINNFLANLVDKVIDRLE
jgi:activating signal cointegrator complex subunit 3